jgi:hypothetical protein
VLAVAVRCPLLDELEDLRPVALVPVVLVDDEVVDPGVAFVVHDALDRHACDGDERPVRVQPEQAIIVLLAPRADELLVAVAPQLPDDGDGLVSLVVGRQLLDASGRHVRTIEEPVKEVFVSVLLSDVPASDISSGCPAKCFDDVRPSV